MVENNCMPATFSKLLENDISDNNDITMQRKAEVCIASAIQNHYLGTNINVQESLNFPTNSDNNGTELVFTADNNNETDASNSEKPKTPRRKNNKWNEEKLKLAYNYFADPAYNQKTNTELAKLIGVNKISLGRYRQDLAKGKEIHLTNSGRRPNYELMKWLKGVFENDNTMNRKQLKQMLPASFEKVSLVTILITLGKMGMRSKMHRIYEEEIVNTPEIINQRYHFAVRTKDVPMNKIFYIKQVQVFPNGFIKRVYVHKDEPPNLKYTKERTSLMCLVGVNGVIRYDIKRGLYDATSYETFLVKCLNMSQTNGSYLVFDPTNVMVNFDTPALSQFRERLILLPLYSQQLNPAHLFLNKFLKEHNVTARSDTIDLCSKIVDLIQTIDQKLIKGYYNFSHKLLCNVALAGKPLTKELHINRHTKLKYDLNCD